MKKLLTLTAISLAVMLAVGLPIAYSQEPPPGGPPGQRGPGGPGGAPGGPGQAAAEKTFSGQLAKVDTAARSIAVKGADNKEMMFSYDDKTQVIGPEKTVQGLAGKTGTPVRVSFREEKGQNLATRIEVVTKE